MGRKSCPCSGEQARPVKKGLSSLPTELPVEQKKTQAAASRQVPSTFPLPQTQNTAVAAKVAIVQFGWQPTHETAEFLVNTETPLKMPAAMTAATRAVILSSRIIRTYVSESESNREPELVHHLSCGARSISTVAPFSPCAQECVSLSWLIELDAFHSLHVIL